MTTILRLTAAQTATLERILQAAETHHRTAADRALRSYDHGTASRARARAHGAAELLHVLRMAQLGPLKAGAA
jgi:hypothetical protein